MDELKRHIIIAPHADDEIIGCWTILQQLDFRDVIVLYGTNAALAEAKHFLEKYNIPGSTASALFGVSPYRFPGVIHAPNPYTEYHPLHKELGFEALDFAKKGRKVVFYSTNMNTDNLIEIKEPELKHTELNDCYPGKKKLWEYDWKYFLFESHTILYPKPFLQ